MPPLSFVRIRIFPVPLAVQLDVPAFFMCCQLILSGGAEQALEACSHRAVMGDVLADGLVACCLLSRLIKCNSSFFPLLPLFEGGGNYSTGFVIFRAPKPALDALPIERMLGRHYP